MIVVAHRSAGHLAPENTLAAIRKAIELGVDYLELDVQTTGDGRLVCSHDSAVDRTTTGTGHIRQMSAEQVRALDVGSKFGPEYAGEQIPFFEDALAACRDKVKVYVDVKDGAAEEVARAVREQGMSEQAVLHVYRIAQARDFARVAPELPVMVSPSHWANLKGFAALIISELGVKDLNSHVRDWTVEAVEDAHQAGAKVWVDIMGDMETEDGMRRIIAMGVDAMQTDRPDLLLRVLARL
jgi:glycerophosphoryl diester phosphodiesterase